MTSKFDRSFEGGHKNMERKESEESAAYFESNKWVNLDKSLQTSYKNGAHSLGSHKMNYSVESQPPQPNQIHTESKTVECDSRRLNIFDTATGRNELTANLSEIFTRGLSQENYQHEDQTCSRSTESRRCPKLTFDANLPHQRRREHTLQWQRSCRDKILDKIRNLEANYSDSETEDVLDFNKYAQEGSHQNQNEEPQEEMEVTSLLKTTPYRGKEGSRYVAPLSVMLSEWFVEKPEDFEDKWIGVLCPVGKRCLIVTTRGRTKIFSRREYYLGYYSSMLPGGRKGGYCVSENLGRGVTILDCIWSDKSQVFYILDLICWNSHPCTNCDIDYRQFFLASKFQENEQLLKRSDLNPYPFIPLPFFTADNFTEIMKSVSPPFPENVDGILFFHREGFYISEQNPLCLWLRLEDVERRLNVIVSPQLMERQEPLKERIPRKPQTNHKKRKGKSSKSKMDVEV